MLGNTQQGLGFQLAGLLSKVGLMRGCFNGILIAGLV